MRQMGNLRSILAIWLSSVFPHTQLPCHLSPWTLPQCGSLLPPRFFWPALFSCLCVTVNVLICCWWQLVIDNAMWVSLCLFSKHQGWTIGWYFAEIEFWVGTSLTTFKNAAKYRNISIRLNCFLEYIWILWSLLPRNKKNHQDAAHFHCITQNIFIGDCKYLWEYQCWSSNHQAHVCVSYFVFCTLCWGLAKAAKGHTVTERPVFVFMIVKCWLQHIFFIHAVPKAGKNLSRQENWVRTCNYFQAIYEDYSRNAKTTI